MRADKLTGRTKEKKTVEKPVKTHLCPNCKEIWDCGYDETCNQPYEVLDPKCDNQTVREKLGGEWLD